MTITVTSIDQGPFTATGLAQTVAYTFMTLTDEEVSVFYDAGDGRIRLDDLSYSVSRNKNIDGSAKEGGSVEVPAGLVPAGSSIYLRAAPTAERDLVWTDTGSRLKNLNEEQDRQVLRTLVILDDLSRAVVVKPGETPLTPGDILDAVDRSEGAAEVAQAAAASMLSSGVPIASFEADGVSVLLPLPVSVPAGLERLVKLFVAGVPQLPGEDFLCDGTSVAIFSNAPDPGALVEGYVEASPASLQVVPTPSRAVPGGRLLSADLRSSRLVDVYDSPLIYKDGVQDDGPGIEAFVSAGSYRQHTSGVLRVSSDTTIGGSLVVTEGQIYIAAGVTLTFSQTASLSAPPTKRVFTGPGSVAGLVDAFPEWFGAVGDFNEQTLLGTDDGPAMARAASSCQRLILGDKAYRLGQDIEVSPTLARSFEIIGQGPGKAGSGSRIYSTGGAIKIRGTLTDSDPSSNAHLVLKGFGLFAALGAASQGLVISADPGKTIRGLNGMLVEDVFVGEFNTNVRVSSVFNLRFRRCRLESQNVAGISCDIGVSAGSPVTSEIAFESTKFTQPSSSPGVAVKMTVADSVSTTPSEMRGITFDDDCQIYAGTGLCIDALVIGKSGAVRTMGDIYLAPGTKLQGDTNITSDGAARFRAQDGGAFSSVHLRGVQIESSEGPALTFQVTTTGSVFGTFHTVSVDGCTFRYNEGRSVQLDGVKGYRVVGNDFAFCGITGSSVVEHIWANNTAAGRIENNIATAKDASAWPGLATGITIAGTTTNVLTRANALGTTTARTGGTDSADQPSTTVQV